MVQQVVDTGRKRDRFVRRLWSATRPARASATATAQNAAATGPATARTTLTAVTTAAAGAAAAHATGEATAAALGLSKRIGVRTRGHSARRIASAFLLHRELLIEVHVDVVVARTISGVTQHADRTVVRD